MGTPYTLLNSYQIHCLPKDAGHAISNHPQHLTRNPIFFFSHLVHICHHIRSCCPSRWPMSALGSLTVLLCGLPSSSASLASLPLLLSRTPLGILRTWEFQSVSLLALVPSALRLFWFLSSSPAVWLPSPPNLFVFPLSKADFLFIFKEGTLDPIRTTFDSHQDPLQHWSRHSSQYCPHSFLTQFPNHKTSCAHLTLQSWYDFLQTSNGICDRTV